MLCRYCCILSLLLPLNPVKLFLIQAKVSGKKPPMVMKPDTVRGTRPRDKHQAGERGWQGLDGSQREKVGGPWESFDRGRGNGE